MDHLRVEILFVFICFFFWFQKSIRIRHTNTKNLFLVVLVSNSDTDSFTCIGLNREPLELNNRDDCNAIELHQTVTVTSVSHHGGVALQGLNALRGRTLRVCSYLKDNGIESVEQQIRAFQVRRKYNFNYFFYIYMNFKFKIFEFF